MFPLEYYCYRTLVTSNRENNFHFLSHGEKVHESLCYLFRGIHLETQNILPVTKCKASIESSTLQCFE